MRMKCGDMFFVADAERVVYISQPQRRWNVKSSNGNVLDMLHVNVSDDRGDARTHGSTKNFTKVQPTSLIITERAKFLK